MHALIGHHAAGEDDGRRGVARILAAAEQTGVRTVVYEVGALKVARRLSRDLAAEKVAAEHHGNVFERCKLASARTCQVRVVHVERHVEPALLRSRRESGRTLRAVVDVHEVAGLNALQ